MRYDRVFLPTTLAVLLTACGHQNKVEIPNGGAAISGTAVMGVGRGADGQTGLISGVKDLNIVVGATLE
ncbi:MAG: hypothetical protein AAGA87_00570 [Pseudomonadota bacterium]